MKNFTIHITPTPHIINDTTKVIGEDLKHRFTFKDAGIAHPVKTIATQNAKSCSILNINRDGFNGLMHLAPELNKSFSELEKNLSKFINELSNRINKKRGNMTAFLTGGMWTDKFKKESYESMNLLNMISKFCDEHEIPLSIIFGKNNPNNFDNVFAKNNYIHLWNKSFEDLNLNAKSSRKEIISALEDQYEIVDIVPEHALDYIVG